MHHKEAPICIPYPRRAGWHGHSSPPAFPIFHQRFVVAGFLSEAKEPSNSPVNRTQSRFGGLSFEAISLGGPLQKKSGSGYWGR